MSLFRKFQSVLLAMCFTLIASAAYAAPPAGDSYLQPVHIAVNATKTVKNIEGATLQGAVEETACDVDDTSIHSVWFEFTLPAYAALQFDTRGSYYEAEPGEMSTHVVLSIHQEALGGGLDHVGCAFGPLLTTPSAGYNPGTYLVRLAVEAPPVVTISGTGQFRLSIRAASAVVPLVDPAFDSLVNLSPKWKIKKAGSPPSITYDCPLDCHVTFNGFAGATLQQSVSFDAADVRMKAGDYLVATVDVNGTPVGGSDVKVTIQISYSNGLPATKASLTTHATLEGFGGSVEVPSAYAEIAHKAVSKFTLKITSPATTDTFSVVSTELRMFNGGVIRTPKALPLPLALQ